ncbi:MAG: hypothetical protein FJ318_09725 [SAR202 cluster bacterium]|nr:hypothetical protein [SAR202 cluster bacterium]
MTYLNIVAWDVIMHGIIRALVVAALVAFSAWVLMLFWGMAAHAGRIAPLSYLASVYISVALWIVGTIIVWAANRAGIGRRPAV